LSAFVIVVDLKMITVHICEKTKVDAYHDVAQRERGAHQVLVPWLGYAAFYLAVGCARAEWRLQIPCKL
jgi:hypothetical protein